jgi:NAD-dependent protein deacetylase/lipoamidase
MQSGTGTMMEIPDPLVETLRRAKHLTVLTGAGISAESGLPTFRDPMTGLWAKYRPEDLATPEAFRRNPRLVWEWYEWRRELVARARPNPGHLALAEMERRLPRMSLLTQNVDGLHRLAGSGRVVELHGNITRSKCFDHHHPAPAREEDGEIPPRCRRCGSFLRPDVVWFGESLPEEAIAAAREAVLGCDLFLSIGTSGTVYPAASFLDEARSCGARAAVVDPDVSRFAGRADFLLQGPSGKVLPALVERAWPS